MKVPPLHSRVQSLLLLGFLLFTQLTCVPSFFFSAALAEEILANFYLPKREDFVCIESLGLHLDGCGPAEVF